MREIVLDTETTGLETSDGHRIIEIGAVELMNRVPTGRTYHQFVNPEREIDADAARVHGITNDKVAGCPKFAEIADDFLKFAEGAALVIHNAPFDMGFLNHEMGLLEKPALTHDVVDTLVMARKKFPGGQANLDALCRRFDIDLSARTYHGALLDAQLLADVYLELTGGRQPVFELDATSGGSQKEDTTKYKKTVAKPLRHFPASEEELANHKTFVSGIDGNLWGYL